MQIVYTSFNRPIEASILGLFVCLFLKSPSLWVHFSGFLFSQWTAAHLPFVLLSSSKRNVDFNQTS